MERLNLINLEFDLADRYNIWSGMTAALFLFLSYFGTWQSQVQRYLGGSSLTQSRMGLIMNGLLKVPMQFIILFIGVMVFVFYQYFQPPLLFNEVQRSEVLNSNLSDSFLELEAAHDALFAQKQERLGALLNAVEAGEESAIRSHQAEIQALHQQENALRQEGKAIVLQVRPSAETRDTDYIFMRFVMDYLPKGIVGLLFAVIFSAAMSSTASELNALGSTSTVDIYRRSLVTKREDNHYLAASKWLTAIWGGFAILFATYASLFENLIQAVNLLGSLFYGTILGIFIVAFYVKVVQRNAVFFAALLSQALILALHFVNGGEVAGIPVNIGFLWYNVIGCLAVVIFGLCLQFFLPTSTTAAGEKNS
ncbi:SSS sodium solute transporter superfamily protein [Nitritalea halalkaliphila LW7]|uniref:SSS sodium solute transporter superfamily protein n=1 Tax=Nitritalea halalkaliphila LW7 TaxID=1189621 RepID=I5C7N1_9BACT|nr:SSS sodium solute transporter superfamily protein [Nitritalea halalkaliphila LW7]